MTGIILKSLLMVAALIAVMIGNPRSAKARDIKGEFAQYSPQQKQWLEDQTVPGNKNAKCCNVADGTQAQEDDYRDGQYWISFEACYSPGNYAKPICRIQDSMPVPEESIIKEPNMFGRPVVWYGWKSWNNETNTGEVFIRCFIPADGL